MPEEIKFYKLAEPYGCFSNFWPSPITDVSGYVWPTSEHLFQSMKFDDWVLRMLILNEPTPKKAAELGRTPHPSYRKDWDDIRDDVMFAACYLKFKQHDDLREILLGTGDARLIEHTKRDSYWGDGGDGSGRNQLGITLMTIRNVFGGVGVV